MPSDYFRFKQFTIHQDKCAMKVCTDACLFGAWAASRLPFTANRLPITVHRILDIGTGTGLLSLMLGQKIDEVKIDAVEIDEAAAIQAKENFDASLWKENLRLHHSSVQQFAETVNNKYDLIISNPPFYETDLKSEDVKINLALHSSKLKLEELIDIAHHLLNNEGAFFVLLPYYRMGKFERLIEERFVVKEKVLFKQTPKHDYFRGGLWLAKQVSSTVQSEIVIMDESGNYTVEFTALLKDYYLYL